MRDSWQVIATNWRWSQVLYSGMPQGDAERLAQMLDRQASVNGINYYAEMEPDDDSDDLAAHLRETVDELRGE